MVLHHPPHVYLDRTWYVITAATLHHAPLLASDDAKCCVRDVLKEMVQKFNVILRAWVILDNHYHLLLKSSDGRAFPRFIGQLHGKTARLINLAHGAAGQRVWSNYWDSCIRTEANLWTRFNYIHYNPVKHGYVSAPDNWKFGSYPYYSHTRGKAWLDDCWTRYPVVDHLEGDDFERL